MERELTPEDILLIRWRPQRAPWRLAAGLGGVAVLAILLVQFRVPPALLPAPAPGEIRVVTYNIRAGLGGVDEVAEDLRRLAPDVVALQEVERGVRRSQSIDQARSLGEKLDMHHVFAASFSVESGEHGIAILSRFPLDEVVTQRLPQGSGRWPRVALKARIDAPGRPFRFVCVHLARPFGWPISNTGARIAQIRALLDELREDELPVIVAGDFNSLPLSIEATIVSRDLRNAWRAWRDGWVTSFPLSTVGWPIGSIKIDHIFHDSRWKSRGNWAAPSGASDHRAVIADLVPVP